MRTASGADASGWPRLAELGPLVVLGIAVPWTVLVAPGPAGDRPFSLVFAWGLVTLDPPHAVLLSDYVFVHTRGLPDRLLALPAGTILFLFALVSAALPTPDDRRVTAGLVVIAGIAHLGFALGVHQTSPALTAVIPIGPVACGALVWVRYPDVVRAAVAAVGRS